MIPLLKTSLIGKVNNLPQFKTEALLPVFEAVVNSIQAIEEYGNLQDGKIIVKINRDGQNCLPGLDQEKQKIIGFEIIDNGVGFNGSPEQRVIIKAYHEKQAKKRFRILSKFINP
jgi:hypothetical protein